MPKHAQPVAVHANTNPMSELKEARGKRGDFAQYISMPKNTAPNKTPSMRQT
jgi:hypothetical protein